VKTIQTAQRNPKTKNTMNHQPNFKIRNSLFDIRCFFLLFLAACLSSASANEKPNIVLIVADDMGYADIGATGVKDIRTPNLDRLAREGTFFSDAYVTGPICVPSRMGIFMGRHQARWGVYTNSHGYVESHQRATAAETTIAEFLKQAGYATALFGKWHLCGQSKFPPVEGGQPEDNGFDEVEVIFGGMAPFWKGTPLYQAGGNKVEAPEYLTDHFGNLSADFVKRKKDSPFFLALMFNAVHAPLHALDEDKAKYDENTHMDRRTYAAMLDSMDKNIGRVLDTLDQLGLADNTLVAFLSDNGGPAHDAPGHSYNMADNGPLRGHKFDVWEGGIRSPMILKWPDRIPAGKRYNGLSSSMDLAATFLAAAGLPAPTDRALDGVNLLPFVNGKQDGEPHEWLAWAAQWRAGMDTALRRGDWKIVQLETGKEGPAPEAWELYHLAKDISETTNVAAQTPDRVQEMADLFHQWRAQMKPAPFGVWSAGKDR